MRTSYIGLLAGLGFAIILIYLLIVVNFQSWLDPFIIITALPAALTGIVLFLFFTRTAISVPALMGSIHFLFQMVPKENVQRNSGPADLLAEIETPEIDQQLQQAQAQLETAHANYELAKTTADRWQFLLKTNSVSK
jgi:hypothetical protein